MEIYWENECRYPLYHVSSREIDDDPDIDVVYEEDELDSARLFLNCEKEKLYADWVPEPTSEVCASGQPRGVALTWRISPYLSNDDVNELLEKVAPFAEKVIDGFRTERDGNNMAGRYGDDAEEALARIGEIADSYRGRNNYYTDDFWDWYEGRGKYRPDIKVLRDGSPEDPYPLYHEIRGEADSVYLIFDVETACIYLSRMGPDRDGELGGEISPYLRYDQINELLDKAIPIAEDILDGHTVGPDGHEYDGAEWTFRLLAYEYSEHDEDDELWWASAVLDSWLEKNRKDFNRWLKKSRKKAASKQAVKA